MRCPFLFALLLAAPVVLAQSARSPSAPDLYHAAAKAYIGGETEQAIRDAERSLALDPGNAKTQRLLDLLRQQQPPQDGEDGPQDDRPEPQENEEQQDQDGRNESERDEAERDETQQNQQQDGQQGDYQDGRSDERQRQNQPTPGEARPARMSAAEAQRLLDAVAADEELLVERMRRPSRMRRSERDW